MYQYMQEIQNVRISCMALPGPMDLNYVLLNRTGLLWGRGKSMVIGGGVVKVLKETQNSIVICISEALSSASQQSKLHLQ